MGYVRVIHKKKKRRKKEKSKKNGQMSELSKQWVLRCPLEKRKK
jgi:hypothetical protein